MGLHYDRIDIIDKDSKSNGAIVPIQILISKLTSMLQLIIDKPTCIVPDVMNNPFLDKNYITISNKI